MKPVQQDIKVESNITGKVIALKFDERSIAHLMGLMIDLYSDKELACLREYSTNAWDAHVEAGNISVPIEVWLPTPLRPELRIKDYGVGLSVEDIENVYSLYGASTKRETNDQVGALGLGCKSALTYSPQFSVIGIKDGIRVMVSVSRDETGGGAMTVVDSKETEEPNGVEIVIPAMQGNNFTNKAKEFFRYWKPGTVKVDGVEPAPPEGLRISDDMLLVEKGYGEPSIMVMGGVSYPIPEEHNPVDRYGNHKLVATVAIGGIEFTPNREQLQMGKGTTEVLKQLKIDYKKKSLEAATKDIATCKKSWEALEKATEWQHALGMRGETFEPMWKGQPVPQVFSLDRPKKPGEEKPAFITLRRDTGGGTSKHYDLDRASLKKILCIEGFKTKAHSRHKLKISKYIQDKKLADMGWDVLIMPDTIPAIIRPWIDPKLIVPWESIKAIEIPVEYGEGFGARKKIAGSFEIYSSETDEEGNRIGLVPEFPANDLDDSKPLYYVPTDLYGENTGWYSIATVIGAFRKCTVVNMHLNRLNKFKRDFPKAIRADAPLKELCDEEIKAIKESALDAWNLERSGYLEFMKSLDPTRLKDPKLKKYVEVARNKEMAKVVERVHSCRRCFASFFPKEVNELLYDQTLDVATAYPLAAAVRHGYDHVKDDLIIYMNAKYEKTGIGLK